MKKSFTDSGCQVVAIIPARYKSNRFEGKPLARICGKPMIQHVVERARQIPVLSRVVVATDDSRIADCVAEVGGEVVMTRSDHISGTDRLAEAAEKMGIADQDIVVNIQGDHPIFEQRVIEQIAEPLLLDPTLPMSTIAYRISCPDEIDDPNHVKIVFDCNMNALYFSRSPIPYLRNPEEGATPTYYRHLGFYAYRKEFLLTFVGMPVGEWESAEKLEQLRALQNGYRIKVAVTEHDCLGVDTPEGLLRVEAMLQNREEGR